MILISHCLNGRTRRIQIPFLIASDAPDVFRLKFELFSSLMFSKNSPFSIFSNLSLGKTEISLSDRCERLHC